MTGDGDDRVYIEAAARDFFAGNLAAAFAATLAAVRLDPYVLRSQILALTIIVRTPDHLTARFVAEWLAACRFGNLDNAAAILADVFTESGEAYPIFSAFSIVALRLGNPDLSRALFSRCLSASLPPSLESAAVESQYGSTAAANYDDAGLHVESVAAFMDFLVRNLGQAGPWDIVDAPCGTGLAGPALRPWALRLVGSDLSAAMVAQARLRGGYDELIVGDLLETLPRLSADLLVSHGSLYHFEELGPVAAAAAASLGPGGWFAFTDYPAPEGVMVTIGGNRRYCRAAQVVRDALASQGFVELASELALTFGLPCVYWLFRKGEA